MKKSIIFTISAVLGVTAIVAISIYVPPARALLGNNPLIVQNPKTFNPYTSPNASASLRAALLGTTKVNGGNYVLYVGSMAYGSNVSFLLGTQANGSDYTTEELSSNVVYPLNGQFGQGITQQQKNANQFAVQPEYLAYINMVTPAEANAAAQYGEMVQKYKDMVIPAGTSSSTVKTDETEKTWAESAPAFSYVPGATYTNAAGKTVPFYNSAVNKNFNNLVSFIKSKFPGMQALGSSPGFVIGYRDGDPDTVFASSYQSKKGAQIQTFYAWLQANYGKAAQAVKNNAPQKTSSSQPSSTSSSGKATAPSKTSSSSTTKSASAGAGSGSSTPNTTGEKGGSAHPELAILGDKNFA